MENESLDKITLVLSFHKSLKYTYEEKRRGEKKTAEKNKTGLAEQSMD